jgi:hypothetical protein
MSKKSRKSSRKSMYGGFLLKIGDTDINLNQEKYDLEPKIFGIAYQSSVAGVDNVTFNEEIIKNNVDILTQNEIGHNDIIVYLQNMYVEGNYFKPFFNNIPNRGLMEPKDFAKYIVDTDTDNMEVSEHLIPTKYSDIEPKTILYEYFFILKLYKAMKRKYDSKRQQTINNGKVSVHPYFSNGGKWSMKYKKSINCKRPKGFSQKQHCKYGRKTRKKQSKKET